MTHSVQKAIVLLDTCLEYVSEDYDMPEGLALTANRILIHAIQHISRPERDIYPKVRGSRKGNPVTRGDL